MIFSNRTDAGKKLANSLASYFESNNFPARNDKLIIVGLPRGGVPVAFEVARKFSCPLDIIVSKKLPFPDQPEYAIGAVSSEGIVVLNPDIPQSTKWQNYIVEQRELLLQRTREIESNFYRLSATTKSDFKCKDIIIVDDGIATGMTALAAISTAQARGANSITIATPIISKQSFQQLKQHCHQLIAIHIPEEFNAVGQFYENFTQTTDEEVIAALRNSREASAQ